MIKKFNLYKESVSDIEQLKQDVKDSLLDLCDELGYYMDSNSSSMTTINVYTIDEFNKEFKNSINLYIDKLLKKSNIVILIRPRYINPNDNMSLDYVHEVNMHRHRTTDILKNVLDRFEGEKYFYEKEKWSWFIFIGK
jgi:hypothetical protein